MTGPTLAAGSLSPAAATAGATAGAIAGASLWWVEGFPVRVLAVSFLAAVAVATSGCQVAASAVAPLVALFYVGLTGRRAAVWACGAISAVLMPGVGWLIDREPLWAVSTLADVALVILPLVAGIAVRSRRDYVAELMRRIEFAERHRDELSLRAVEQERLRIARDLHDILSHTISTINVQAGVAQHLLARDPEVAGTALAAIKTASREAMHELREVLGILRDTADGPGVQGPEGTCHLPAPRLDALPALILERQLDGLPIRLRVDVDPDAVAGSVQLAAYRIVQEALTNVLRHAGRVPTEVDIEREDASLVLRVQNKRASAPVGAAATEGTSVGLAGMRERVAALSGTMTAEHLPDHGFRVLARLPLGGAP